MATIARRGPGRPKDPGLPARRKCEILDAATAVFAEHGYRCADLQDVADRLSVGKGTLYRYFPSKQALFQAAVDRVMVRLRGTIDAAIEGVEEPLERLGRAVRAYLAYFDEHPEYVELLIQERAEFRDRRRPTYFVHQDANIGRWRELYARLIREGRVRSIPVDRITDVVSDLLYGTMFTNYFAGRRRSLAEQADGILDILLNGLLTGAGNGRRAGRGGRTS